VTYKESMHAASSARDHLDTLIQRSHAASHGVSKDEGLPWV